MRRPIRRDELRPSPPRLRTARPHTRREMRRPAVGDEELCVLGPAIEALAEADLVVAEGLAVGRRGVLSVRRAIADVAVEHDKGRAFLGAPEDLERLLDAVDVVGIAHA